MQTSIHYLFIFILLGTISVAKAGNVAYIYGDVSKDGDIPSGSKSAFHQMLLTDSGNRGMSQFRSLVQGEGHTINQYYDRSITLNAAFLNQFDAIVFGLHQKQWSTAEKNALDAWIRAGGGALFYSDSAAGGQWNIVGAQNPVGQRAVNNVTTQYGMQVTVDQAAGTTAYRAGNGASHPITTGRLVLEGEGVSPVAVDFGSGAEILIPYSNNSEFKVSGNATIRNDDNITINNDGYAALALNMVGDGAVIVMFDRQPMWNNGEGSDINERDNKEILKRIVNFMVGETINEPCIKTTERIEAECFDAMSGIETEPSSEGTDNIGFINNNDWTLYEDIDLTGVNSVEARVASIREGTIEVRLDALQGELLASIPVTSTGGWQNWVTEQASTSSVSGVHDIYLVFKGGDNFLFNINYFGFLEQTLSIDQNKVTTITAFPNPLIHTLNIHNGKDLTVELYNNIGQLKYTRKMDRDVHMIAMNSFAPGVYFLKTYKGKSVSVQKIVKK